MTRPTPRTVPMLTEAAKEDPVLAERDSEYEYVRNPRARKYIIYAAALFGVVIIFLGGSLIVRAESLNPVGVGMVVGGFLAVLPTLYQLTRGGSGKWVVRTGHAGRSRLWSDTFVLDGGEERAAEVYRIISESRDARSWPVFSSTRTKGDIRLGLYIQPGVKEAVVTLWMPREEEALVWPILTPPTEHLGAWLKSVYPRSDAASDHATYIQNVLD